MVASPLSSSEAFIKALKAPTDPPTPGGLYKIEIATAAVSQNSLYIPAKNEIVVEWVLSQLAKSKKSLLSENACLDGRYWELLAQILVQEDVSARSRSTSVWLQPLLLRYSLLSLVSVAASHAAVVPQEVLGSVFATLKAVSASTSTKFTYESAWELLKDLITSIADANETGDGSLSWVNLHPGQAFAVCCVQICGEVLTEPSNRKKSVNAFANGLLCNFISAQAALSSSPTSALAASALSTFATSVLFSPDAIRQQTPLWTSSPEATTKDTTAPSTSLNNLSHQSRIFTSPEVDSESTLIVLPQIFRAFVSSVQYNRSSIFSGSSGHGPGFEKLSLKQRAKGTCLQFLQVSLRHISDILVDHEDSGWRCVCEMLNVTEEEKLAGIGDRVGQTILIEIAKRALARMTPNPIGYSGLVDKLQQSLLRVLIVVTRIDFDLLENLRDQLFAALALIPSSRETGVLLDLIVTYHVKTRTLHTLTSSLVAALLSASRSPPYSSSIERNLNSPSLHTTLLSSRLSDRSFTSNLSDALSRFLTPSQVPAVISTVTKALRETYERFADLKSVASQHSQKTEQKKTKKRKHTYTEDPPELTSTSGGKDLPAQAARVSAILRLAPSVLRSLPLNTVSNESLEEITRNFARFWKEVVKMGVEDVFSSYADAGSRTKERTALDEVQAVDASFLRCVYELQGTRILQLIHPSGHDSDEGGNGFNSATREGFCRALPSLLDSHSLPPELRIELFRTGMQSLSPSPTVSSPILQFTSQSQTEFFESCSRMLLFSTVLSSELMELDRDNRTPSIPPLKGSWDGRLASLSRGAGDGENRGSETVALWEALMGRWLGAVDEHAPEAFLRQLVDTLIVLVASSNGTFTNASRTSLDAPLTLQSICRRALACADFWELHNLRPILLQNLTQSTRVLLEESFLDTLQSLELSPLGSQTSAYLTRAIRAIQTMLYIPSEYTDKHWKIGMIDSALRADVRLFALLKRADAESMGVDEPTVRQRDSFGVVDLIHVRSVLVRLLEESGRADLLTTVAPFDILRHLTQPLDLFGLTIPEISTLEDITLRVMAHLHTFILASVPSKISAKTIPPCDLLSFYISKPALSGRVERHMPLQDRCAAQVLGVFILSFSSSSSPPAVPIELLRAAERLYQHLLGVALRLLGANSQSTTDETYIITTAKLLDTYGELNKFAHWLETKSGDQASLGLSLDPHAHTTPSVTRHLFTILPTLCQSNPGSVSIQRLCVSLLQVSLLKLSIKSRVTQQARDDIKAEGNGVHNEKIRESLREVEMAVAECVLVASFLPVSKWKALTPAVALAFKALPVEVFSHALDLLVRTRGIGHGHNARDIVLRLHIAGVLVRHSPDGCMKVNQEYTSRILHCITGLDFSVGYLSKAVLLEVLSIVGELAGDKAATLRNTDMNAIFTVVGGIIAPAISLSGSQSRDSALSAPDPDSTITTTATAVYESTTHVLMTLIRLRRDLVSHTLPHLASVLSRLLEILRCLRPELGLRAQRSLTERLPWWADGDSQADPSCRLGSESAKSLARLLTNLTTKTTIRTVESSTNQTQSLGQPFSKHAPYVLTAYIRALIDPVSVMLPAVRRELEPGLFVLCEIMGEYGRDAVMISMLDDGGKAMMKEIWREYEKQKYTGKG